MKEQIENLHLLKTNKFLFVLAPFLYMVMFIQPSFGRSVSPVDSISLMPVNLNSSSEDTLTYAHNIQAFIEWAIVHEDQKSIEIKLSRTKTDNRLAKIQFHSFKVKTLEEFFKEERLKGIKGTVSGYLNIEEGYSAPKITGNINVLKGRVKLLNFGKQSLENVSIDTSSTLYKVNRFDSLRIDVAFHFGEGFFIRNTRFLPMKVGLSGTLHVIKKAGQKVQLTGTLKAVEGFTEPLGKQFDLAQGAFIYTGTIDNPQIYLKSLYQPHREEQDIKIWYIIEGTIEDPSFKFQSDPKMEAKNILSYTLFGQPFYLLASVEQSLVKSVATTSTADYTAEVLLNRIETVATQKLGVDVVRIDNTTAESGTVITTGWYINPKVFFAIQNVLAGNPHIGFYLEYYLNENLKLILSQDNDYGQGIDLQWEYDY